MQVRVDMTSSHSDMTVPQRADTALLRVNLLPVVWKSSLVHVYHHESMLFLVFKLAKISVALILPCVQCTMIFLLFSVSVEVNFLSRSILLGVFTWADCTFCERRGGK